MEKTELVARIRELANDVEDMDLSGLGADTMTAIGNALYRISEEAESIDNSLGTAYESAESAEDYAQRAKRELENIGTEDINSAITDLRRTLEDANAIEY